MAPDVEAGISKNACTSECTDEGKLRHLLSHDYEYGITDLAKFRIGVDNMIAAGFELGYAAALDDARPARALRDPQPGAKARAQRAAKRKR